MSLGTRLEQAHLWQILHWTSDQEGVTCLDLRLPIPLNSDKKYNLPKPLVRCLIAVEQYIGFCQQVTSIEHMNQGSLLAGIACYCLIQKWTTQCTLTACSLSTTLVAGDSGYEKFILVLEINYAAHSLRIKQLVLSVCQFVSFVVSLIVSLVTNF